MSERRPRRITSALIAVQIAIAGLPGTVGAAGIAAGPDFMNPYIGLMLIGGSFVLVVTLALILAQIIEQAEGAASTAPSSTPKPRPRMRGKRACDE